MDFCSSNGVWRAMELFLKGISLEAVCQGLEWCLAPGQSRWHLTQTNGTASNGDVQLQPSQLQPQRIPSGFAPGGNGWNIFMLNISQVHGDDGFQVKFAWNISLIQSFCSQSLESPCDHPHVPLSHHHWGFYSF